MIDKLEMFIALAREEHFGRAAAACGVAQPTLSAAIRQLESDLGVTLVHRGARYRGLTPEGARALDWARRIAGDARALRADMRGARDGLTGDLRIAAIPTALPAASDLTAAFAAKRPGVRIALASRTATEILSGLANAELDLGITYLDDATEGRAEATPLYRETYAALSAPGGPLGARTQVGWDTLASLPLALLSPDMQNRRIIDSRLGPARAQVESNSVLVLISHVRTGGWVTILPERTAAMFAGADLRAVPVADDGPAPLVGLLSPRRGGGAPLAEALIRLAEARFQ